jgi:hypothetical protein
MIGWSLRFYVFVFRTWRMLRMLRGATMRITASSAEGSSSYIAKNSSPKDTEGTNNLALTNDAPVLFPLGLGLGLGLDAPVLFPFFFIIASDGSIRATGSDSDSDSDIDINMDSGSGFGFGFLVLWIVILSSEVRRCSPPPSR